MNKVYSYVTSYVKRHQLNPLLRFFDDFCLLGNWKLLTVNVTINEQGKVYTTCNVYTLSIKNCI